MTIIAAADPHHPSPFLPLPRDSGIFDTDQCGVANDCKTAGNSVIAAATFAMLFGVLSVVFLHLYTTCKDRCRFPFPRIFLLVSNFLSLCLYITVVATWYSKCQNTFSSSSCNVINSSGLAPGYCIATAIVCIVMSFFAWAFSFWRTCRPNKDEPASSSQKAESYGQQSSASDLGVASPSAVKAPYTAAAAPAAAEGRGGGYSNGGAYGGGQTYGNDDADDSSAGGYGGGGGGYGGSYGGAYSNSGYGGNSAKQQSAYGY